MTFDPGRRTAAAELASRIVWFDAYVTNVDRTVRNTNMLMWHRAPVADRSRGDAVLSSLAGMGAASAIARATRSR